MEKKYIITKEQLIEHFEILKFYANYKGTLEDYISQFPPSSNSLQGMREITKEEAEEIYFNFCKEINVSVHIVPPYLFETIMRLIQHIVPLPFLSQPIESTNKVAEGKWKEAEFRTLLNDWNNTKFSFSRMVEIINERICSQLDNKKQVEEIECDHKFYEIKGEFQPCEFCGARPQHLRK